MKQLEAILHAPHAKLFERAHDFGGAEAEFGTITARGLPAAGAAAGQLGADADGGADTDALGILRDEPELGVFFDDGYDVTPDLLREHGHLDVFVVLEAITDDGRFVICERHDGEELGFRTGFQTKLEGLAEFEDFLDDLALLIHFDGIDAAVIAVVLVFADGDVESVVQFAEAVLQDFGEADQNGE